MTNQQKSLKAFHIGLWITQVLLGTGLIFGGAMKLFQPIEKLAALWPWAGQAPSALVRFTGTLDLLGAIGMILPSLLGVRPKLTPIAAVCIFVLMVCASIFHVVRGEASSIGVNIFFAILAVFVAWGRVRKAPIAAK